MEDSSNRYFDSDCHWFAQLSGRMQGLNRNVMYGIGRNGGVYRGESGS